MQIIKIKKRSGGIRTIYAPNKDEKAELRALLPLIPQPTDRLCSAHGFMKARNPVTNALPHIPNHVYGGTMISLDLSDFFNRVTAAQIAPFLPQTHREEILQKCIIDGATQQGLPTSPALANLAGISIDEAIRRKIKKCWHGAIYTRYADDLSISFPEIDRSEAKAVVADISEIVQRCGHTINKRKIRIQHAKGGRWECCGVMVDDDGIHISRNQRRKLRLALYVNEKFPSRSTKRKASGLLEWSKLKKPLTVEERRLKALREIMTINEKRIQEAETIAKIYNLPYLDKYHDLTPDIYLDGGAIITQDPVMIYGMSTLTNGWTSCMNLGRANYDYRYGTEFWRRLRGISIAYIPDKQVKVWNGVTRPKMKERALIYELRNGYKAYGNVYPRKGMAGMKLGDILQNAGYLWAGDCNGEKIVGHVSTDCPKPYFDFGGCEIITLKESQTKAYRVYL